MKTTIVVINPKKPLSPEVYPNLKIACDIKEWSYDTLRNKTLPVFHKEYYIIRTPIIREKLI